MTAMENSLIGMAEALRVEVTGRLDPGAQARHGQYFTPERAAVLIAGFPRLPTTGTFRVLDPGAGSGMLTAALVERIATEAPELTVEVDAVEVDPAVLSSLDATARMCEKWSAVTTQVSGWDPGVALQGVA